MPLSQAIFPVSGSSFEISGNAQTFSLPPANGGVPPAGAQSLFGSAGTVSLGLDLPFTFADGDTFPAASTAEISMLKSASGFWYSSTISCCEPAFAANGICQRGNLAPLSLI